MIRLKEALFVSIISAVITFEKKNVGVLVSILTVFQLYPGAPFLAPKLRPAGAGSSQQTNKNAALFIVYERARPNGETPSDSRSRLHLTKNGGKKVAACFFPTAWMRIMTLH